MDKLNIGVFYYWQPFNKINGSLFYTFEYAQKLLKSTNTKFYIVGITKIKEADKKLILESFLQKYDETKIDLTIIEFISMKDCYILNKLDRFLFLDINSYNKLYFWFREKNFENLYLFCNNKIDMLSTIQYPKNLFGYYEDYQLFNYKNSLKLNFSIFKTELYIDNQNSDTLFVSSIDSSLDDIIQYIPNFISFKFKQHSICLNIFETFSDFLYIQNGGLDTNNRLIPEAKFYNKKLNVIFVKEEYKNDSIYDRWINDWSLYDLTDDDLLIQSILERN